MKKNIRMDYTNFDHNLMKLSKKYDSEIRIRELDDKIKVIIFPGSLDRNNSVLLKKKELKNSS